MIILVVVLWIAYAIALSVWVIMQQRDPAATLAWIFSLIFLPYLGFVIFYFLGPRRLKRNMRLRHASYEAVRNAFAPEATASDADSPHDLSVQLTELVKTTTGMPLSTATSIKLLVDGSRKYDGLIEDITAARDHVHMEYYIYAGDGTGALIRDALVAALQRGVKVRLLIDGAGSFKTSDTFLEPLEKAGAELAVFHPVVRGIPGLRPMLNYRSHRKIVVIDGRLGYTGGINVTDEENDRLSPDSYYRDLHVRIEGDVVSWMQRIFLEDWHYASTRTPDEARLFGKSSPGRFAIQLIPSGPDNPDEPIHRANLAAINVSDKRVWLCTPYFVPTAAAFYALTSAAMRGLDVRVMVPRKSDSRLVDLAARSYFGTLLASGVRVFEYQPRMIHSKVLIVDEAFAILGSANFDNRSFHTNFELSVAVHESELVAALEEVWQADQANCVELMRNAPPPRFSRRLGESFARLCSPLL